MYKNVKKTFEILHSEITFLLNLYCFWHAFASVYCYFVVTFWERADLLILVCGVFLCFCHFQMWYLRSGVVLDCIDS